MKTTWVCIIASLSLFLAGQLYAGSVYFWTDENGVRHFSNTGVPDDVQEADVRPEESSAPQPYQTRGQSRLDNNGKESPPGAQEGEAGQAVPGSGNEEQLDKRLAAKVEKERQRLEAEIKRIEGRGMSQTYTQGMKDAQLAPLKEQLALLNADPERYFRMRGQGAFQSSSSAESGTLTSEGPLGGRLSNQSGRSSIGGSNAEGAVTPDEKREDEATEKAPSDEKKSRKSISSGSAANSLFPEND